MKSIKTPKAPRAPKKEHTNNYPFARISDPYFWIKDRKDPDTMKYLKAENKYSDQIMKPHEKVHEKIYKEMKSYIKEDDSSPEAPWGDYLYFTKFKKGQQYPIYCRRLKTSKKIEILLDCNLLAKGKKQFDLSIYKISPNHKILAYGVDTSGSETYTIYFKDLSTGKLLKDKITNASRSTAFAEDSKTFFYTVLNSQHRPHQIARYVIGSKKAADIVYEDTDAEYFVGLNKSSDNKFIFMGSYGKITSETWFVDAESPMNTPVCIEPRFVGHDYSVDARDGYFYILSDRNAPNKKLMITTAHQHNESYWQEFVPEDKKAHIKSISIFEDHLILHEQFNALPRWRVYCFSKETWKTVPFKDKAFFVHLALNFEFNTDKVRVVYQSPIQPKQTYDLNLNSFKKKIIKEEKIKGYDPKKFSVERIYVKGHDSALIPLTVFYKRGFKKNAQAPTMLYGYGSYGYTLNVGFNSKFISYLNRGFAFAYAHIRGGSDLGRQWYEDGKFLKKKNSFYDFISCAEYLVQKKWTNPSKLSIMGGSAGGMLMGAVLNMRPDLFGACVAHVPFVDVINTMYDDSLPLTKLEYTEWGNPHKKEFFEYMRSYSPYDNVEAKAYPPLMITGGLNDFRVTYWEPAKWCAKLREMKTDNNLLLMRIKMAAGHFGASGRFDHLKEEAETLVFLLKALNLKVK